MRSLVANAAIMTIASTLPPGVVAASSSTLSTAARTTLNKRNSEPTKSEYGYPLYRLRVLFIRHGESQNNVMHAKSPDYYRQNRYCDPELSPRGKQQALACGQYLADHESFADFNPIMGDIEAIYVSPMLRTLQTAKPIGVALNVNPEVWTDIYEVSGIHEGGVGRGGLTRREILQMFPNYKLPHDVTDDKGWYPIERNKETRAMAIPRIQGVADRLYSMATTCLQERKSKTIALVCHGDFKDMVLQDILGLPIPMNKKRKFLSYNTAITVVDVDVVSYNDDNTNEDTNDNRHATLLLQNFVGHLNSSLITHEDLGIV